MGDINTRLMLGTVLIDNLSTTPEKHHHVELAIDLTQEKYDELSSAMATLSKYMHDSQLYMIVIWNFYEFIRVIDSYLEAYTQKIRNTLRKHQLI
jgi:hypothetical protein